MFNSYVYISLSIYLSIWTQYVLDGTPVNIQQNSVLSEHWFMRYPEIVRKIFSMYFFAMFQFGISSCKKTI